MERSLSRTDPSFLLPPDSRLEVLGPLQEPRQAGERVAAAIRTLSRPPSRPEAFSLPRSLDWKSLGAGPIPGSPEATQHCLSLPPCPQRGSPRPQ